MPGRVCCKSFFSFWLLVVTFNGLDINRLVCKWSCLPCSQLAAWEFGLAGQAHPFSTAFFGISNFIAGHHKQRRDPPKRYNSEKLRVHFAPETHFEYFKVMSRWKWRTCKYRQQIIGLVDELKKLCTETIRAETCVAPRLDMHVDASRGALRTGPSVVLAVFVVLALSANILFEFLRTSSSSSSSSSIGRKARGGVYCQSFTFCSLFPA